MIQQHKTFIIIAVLIAFTALSSCTLETSDNGDLDGFWHLERIDTISTGGSYDMSGQIVFWSVQKDLLNVTDYNVDITGYVMHFEHSDNTLRIYDPYDNERADGDIKLEDATVLAPFGINALDETFTIDHLDSSDMTLSTEELRLYFHKM